MLAGLTIDALAGVWAELGMSCESLHGGGPEAAADYGVHCEAPNPGDSGVEVVAGAAYWTTSSVAEIEVVVSPGMEGSIDAAAFANAWVVPFAELVGGPGAVAFVLDHVDDLTCGDGCTMAIDGSDLSYYTGHRGAQELFFVPRFT